MKLILFRRYALACLALAAVFTTSCKKEKTLSSSSGDEGAQKKGGAEGAALASWVLVWSDEFNGTSVNTTNWNFETGAGGWGNNEQQYYRSQNATVSNGNLVITAKRESFGGANYTSARMTTQNKRTFTYGKMEARIKLPLGQGLWPAFWMLGSDIGKVGWPDCGEIDIMEFIGKEPFTVFGTIHGPGYSGANGISRSTTVADPGGVAGDFHVFAVEWAETEIKWFLDGKQYAAVTKKDLPSGTKWVFDHPYFIILNFAVGGKWPGSPSAATKFPQSMLIDYVRVSPLLSERPKS